MTISDQPREGNGLVGQRSKGTSTILRIFEIGIFNWEAQEVEDALILSATAHMLAHLNILSGCHRVHCVDKIALQFTLFQSSLYISSASKRSRVSCCVQSLLAVAALALRSRVRRGPFRDIIEYYTF